MAVKDELLDVARVVEVSGLRPQTIRAYLLRGKIPPPDERLGGRPVWRRRTIERWMAAREP